MRKAEKDRLDLQRGKYLRIKRMTECEGWKDFKEIISEEYSEMLNVLKAPTSDKEERECRGALKFIDRIFGKLDSDLKFGKFAQKKYVEKILNNAEGA